MTGVSNIERLPDEITSLLTAEGPISERVQEFEGVTCRFGETRKVAVDVCDRVWGIEISSKLNFSNERSSEVDLVRLHRARVHF